LKRNDSIIDIRNKVNKWNAEHPLHGDRPASPPARPASPPARPASPPARPASPPAKPASPPSAASGSIEWDQEKRCPKGYSRNKKTRRCTPAVKPEAAKPASPPAAAPRSENSLGSIEWDQTKRCPSGYSRNKKTKKCKRIFIPFLRGNMEKGKRYLFVMRDANKKETKFTARFDGYTQDDMRIIHNFRKEANISKISGEDPSKKMIIQVDDIHILFPT